MVRIITLTTLQFRFSHPAPVVHACVATSSTSHFLSLADVSNYCKNHPDGVFADPKDCTYFVECANGNTYRERCAPGTAWSDSIKTCDRMANVPGCNRK